MSKTDWSLVFYFAVSALYFIIHVIYSSVWTISYNNLTRTLTEYFLCEALGSNLNECNREEFEKYSFPYLEGFTALCRILVPIGILVLAVNGQGISTREPSCSCNPSPPKIEEKEKKISIINPAYI